MSTIFTKINNFICETLCINTSDFYIFFLISWFLEVFWKNMVQMDSCSEWSVGMYEKMAVFKIPAAWEGVFFMCSGSAEKICGAGGL